MKDEFLVISTSLNPDSNSRKLAQAAFQALQEGHSATRFVDLQEYKLPFCDGDACYADPLVGELSTAISGARCVLLAVPIYNYDVSAVAKNLIELTGKSWNNKVVGFLCAAGGRSSYMSVMGFANSLMLDFRCLIIPRFVYAEGSAFSDEEVSSPEVLQRIKDLTASALELGKALAVPALSGCDAV